MKINKIIKRFFIPKLFISVYYFVKHGCMISPSAEVEFSSQLEIGENTEIGSFTKIKTSNGPLKIGKNVSITTGCFITPFTKGIEIGDDCLIGPNVAIVGNNYKYDQLDIPFRLQGYTSKGVKIGKNVWIGASCTILDGAEIGDGVIISPNSVVSSKFPPHVIIQGNPGKTIFTRR